MKDIYKCKAYACYLKDKEELKKSTSGGVFFALAKKIIEADGVVFGAAFKDKSSWEVWHTNVQTLGQLDALRESKYVQSRIGDSYINVKGYLDEGKQVLFSGTPCQIAGLHSFLGKEYENLLLVEVICHGVPSASLLKKHLYEKQKKCGKKLENIKFRDKINGWDELSVSYQFHDIIETRSFFEDEYTASFNMYYSLRPSCYNCKFINMNSGADITIGDYWGLKNEHSDFWNVDGVSAVILKSKKGETIFEKCKKNLFFCKSSVWQIAKNNMWLVDVKGRKKARQYFFEDYKKGIYNLGQIKKDIDDKLQSQYIGVIGSYSLRKIVHALRFYNPRIEISYQITSSALCSMFDSQDKNMAYMISQIMLENGYRLTALKNDFTKQAKLLIQQVKCDYIMIDFLEERYPLLKVNNTFYTKSETMIEVKNQLKNFSVEQQIFMYDLPFEVWRQYCDCLIAVLKENYKSSQIILNRLYLTENIGIYKPQRKFEQLYEIRKINERLKQYYDYFEENMDGYVIGLNNRNTNYCSELFEYGCAPESYNEQWYREFGNQIIDVVGDF